MAMTPKSVKIDNVDIKDVDNVDFDLDTPVTHRNYFETYTTAGTIRLRREALRNPIPKLFQLATNEDGRRKLFDGEIVLWNANQRETHTLGFKKAFLASWEVENTVGTPTPAQEYITIQAGEIQLRAGSNQADFKVRNWHRE